MKLLLVNRAKERIPQSWLQRVLSSLSRQLNQQGFKGLASQELVVVFVRALEMRRLNRVYRHQDSVTDILSFASDDPLALGELVICLPVIKKQKQVAGHSLRAELGLMLIHGVLHLLGMDHMSSQDELKMFSLQDKLFQRLAKVHFPLR